MKQGLLVLLGILGLNLAGWSADSLADLPPIGPDTLRVFIVRHAETHHNVDAKMEPTSNLYNQITDNGKKQAAVMGEMLKDQPIVAAFTSEIARTKETLALSRLPELKHLEAKSDPAFNGIKPGKREDGTPGNLSWRVELWKKGSDPTPPDGESMREACRRVFERLRLERSAFGQAIVVVTHGDIQAGLIGSLQTLPPWDRWPKCEAPTGSITVIDVVKMGPPILRIPKIPMQVSE